MLEAFFLNIFILFVQILISLFLIWLCNREDEDDDENDIFCEILFKKQIQTQFFY